MTPVGRGADRARPVFHFDGVKLTYPFLDDLPMYLGAIGPKMPGLSGEIADGTLGPILASPQYVGWSRQQIDAGARAAGKADRPHRLAGTALFSVDFDSATARAAVRGFVVLYVSAIPPENSLFRNYGISDAVQELQGLGAPEEIERELPDQWVDDLTVAADPVNARRRSGGSSKQGTTSSASSRWQVSGLARSWSWRRGKSSRGSKSGVLSLHPAGSRCGNRRMDWPSTCGAGRRRASTSVAPPPPGPRRRRRGELLGVVDARLDVFSALLEEDLLRSFRSRLGGAAGRLLNERRLGQQARSGDAPGMHVDRHVAPAVFVQALVVVVEDARHRRCSAVPGGTGTMISWSWYGYFASANRERAMSSPPNPCDSSSSTARASSSAKISLIRSMSMVAVLAGCVAR